MCIRDRDIAGKKINYLDFNIEIKDNTQYVAARYMNILPNILHNELKKLGIIVILRAVSYTHLDVYKRQVDTVS